MALSQSVASELLEAFRAGEGVDLIRESVRLVMQELIETEASEASAPAAMSAPSPGHRTERVPAAVGRDAGRGCGAADPEAAAGLVLPGHPGTPAADRPGPVCGGDGGLGERGLDPGGRRPGRRAWASSPASPSRRCRRICAGLDEQVAAFRDRPLHHTAFPYVFLDATYLHVRRTGPAARSAAGRSPRWPSWSRPASPPTVAGRSSGWTSATPRTRCFGAGSSAPSKQRGLHGVRLVISDQHAGLVAALGRVFQGVGHQRCRVHFARNLLALVPKSHKDMVAAVFRTAFAQPDADAAAASLGPGPRPARRRASPRSDR